MKLKDMNEAVRLNERLAAIRAMLNWVQARHYVSEDGTERGLNVMAGGASRIQMSKTESVDWLRAEEQKVLVALVALGVEP